MTLRLRLVLALVALVAVGLAVFGVATTAAYSRAEHERLDDQLHASQPFVTGQLYAQVTPPVASEGAAEGDSDGYGGPPPGSPPGGRPVVPSGTYAELRDPDGTVLATIQPWDSTSDPALPEGASAYDETTLSTTGSTDGSGRWRVSVSPSDHGDGNTVVVAVPMDELAASLRRLVLIEGAAAIGLLVALAAGGWFVLRRGLRPLEHMATSARSITAGDLSQRVEPADSRSEVGQLGLALNTMLGEIEDAFQEREATEQRLRQFLADASHELRTPLTSIQGFAELFRVGGEKSPVDLAIILRRIEEESARMKVLVDDLLLLARLDETRPVERQPVDLAVLAADACTDAVATDPGRRVTLDAPRPVVVEGDQDHLRQAIANLLSNALAHTPPRPPVEVAARRDNGMAVVTVRDHGRGLDDDALRHVFDRFWRADQARVGSGSGLKLSIVAAIAHEHGGSVGVSNAEGGGARFVLSLPPSSPTNGHGSP
jgi:two-component system OmpR family sensor kinase